ncbi:histidinol-phosphatase [Desulfovibrio mangrovi]|uniref:histidinol-phosphatase n=1 Tax=Desulfovibrio mangrovi TaxID=2976983 RepID=UPI002246C1FA|nr:histidinol-phosphatase [Desulfovibrio mangrovi]UZP68633.1 histidinol-phosphatase [Desulfovibrio mangrovi]
MITVDTHIHTSFSHGKATVQEMYTAAREKGMTVFGFSEHSPRPAGFDYPTDYKAKLTAAWPEYVQQVTALKSNDDNMKVLFGIEMDWTNGQEPYIREKLSADPFDYVIAGIHFLDTWGFDFKPDDWSAWTAEECHARYEAFFTSMIAVAQTGLFNIIAHPDIIKIFTVDTFSSWIATPNAQEVVRSALKAVKDAGMAMEISSAGLRKLCKEIYPGPFLMKAARELNLPISFGSDAHSTASVGYAFDQLETYARSYGYSESVYFENRTMQVKAF